MATRNLYLHETVDIVGQGQYDYMEHLWADPVLRMPEMFGLQGAFYVCAAGGGRWPQVINVWDIGSMGWEGWQANVDRMNLKRRKAFGEWWDKAAAVAHGWVRPSLWWRAGQPHRGDRGGRHRGTLFLHGVLTVRPGSAARFLGAVVRERVPFMADFGHRPPGSTRSCRTSTRS
jgi:hypothetical protein